MQNLVRAAPYLAPERARGGPASQAGDVYALGVILCISGGAPLPAAPTTLGAVHMVASGEWVPRIPSFFPESWISIITRMLDVNPGARPGAAEAAQVFAEIHRPSSIATVPEMPAVRLPPSLATRDEIKTQQADVNWVAPVLSLLENKASLDAEPTPASEVNAAELEMAAVVTPSVAMTDSLLVAPELLADGAVTLAPDNGRSLRSRKPWVILGAVTAAALAVGGLWVTSPSPEAQAADGPVSVTLEPGGSESVHSDSAPSDDLTPLPELSERKRPTAVKPGKAAPTPAPKGAFKTPQAQSNAGARSMTGDEKGTPVSASPRPHLDELKRPSPEGW